MKLKLCILMLCSFNLFAQQETKKMAVNFHPVFGNSPIYLNDSVYTIKSDTFRFESLKFYISEIELFSDKSLVWSEKNSFHLIDISDPHSLNISFQIPPDLPFDQVSFNSGIDSMVNVSGAMGGDLDPTRGMYWTWQNGYINFKLEGASNLSSARNKQFQFHLGGYQFPHNSCRKVLLQVENTDQIDVFLDIREVISAIDFQKKDHIMSPGKEAQALSEKVAQLFKINLK